MIHRHGFRSFVRLWLTTHRVGWRKALRIALVVAGVWYVCQLVYPTHHLLPFVRVANQAVGFRSAAAATKKLDTAFARQLQITTDATTYSRSLASLGGTPQTKSAVARAADYPFLQRLVPFSSLYVMLTRNNQVTARFQGTELAAFAAHIEAEAHRAAVNATVKVENAKAVLVPAIPEKSYPARSSIQSLQTAVFVPTGQVHLPPKTTPAARTDAATQPTVTTANAAIAHPPQLRIGDRTVRPKGKELASWLQFPEDASSQLNIALKPDALSAYLIQVQGDDYQAPGKTHVQQIDGREVNRIPGKAGHGVDTTKATELLTAAVRSGEAQTVILPVGKLEPTVAYDNTVSNTDKEFADLLATIARTKGGYGIAAMQVDGKAGKASGDKQFIAASTYKLFVAYVWFKKVEAGADTWSETINGKTATKCFEDMIVVSDNPCAQAFATKVGGWSYVSQQMKAIGLTDTALAPGNLRTTASDLAYLLYRLENGTLVQSADRTRLLDLMKRQVYRDGIPAGTGATVADKVGFVDGYFNDAGIVYGHKGTYILVLMSYGSNWGQLADAAHQIHAYLTK